MTSRSRSVVLFFLGMGLAVNGYAQAKPARPAGGDDKFIVSALTALKANNLDDAKQEIDKAFTPETKDKAKALFVKAEIYISLQQQEKNKGTALYQDAAKALFKLVESKPDYEKATVNQLLLYCGFAYYNDGVKANTDRKFPECMEIMKNVQKVHDVNGGVKKFEGLASAKQFDTVYAAATLAMANSAYLLAKFDEAIPLFVSAKNNPITKSAVIYECLIQAYNFQKNTKDVFAVIEEARNTYPDSLILRNQELNYYLSNGKHEELARKLEAAAVKEPNNSEIQSNLAFAYLSMANAKDAKKAGNYAELIAKAEEAFKAALKLSPENGSSNYNFGALYFNQGIDLNEQMNAIAASPAPDQKKYDDLKAKRDALFFKAAPYLEKTYSIYSANEANLRGDDPANYKGAIAALSKVYAAQNKTDKAAEMNRKYESMK